MNSKREELLYDSYEKNGWWNLKTHSEELHEQVEKRGDKIAVIDFQRVITFKQLESESEKMAAYFLSQGIAKGDKIVLQHINTISFAVICFALFRIGAIPVLAMPAHRETEVSGIIDKSHATGYIVIRSFHGYNYEKMAKNINEKHRVIKYFWFVDELESIDLEEYSLNRYNFEEPNHRDIAMIVLSGGSTGNPKLIPRLHASFLHEQRYCAKTFGVKENSIVLIAMQLTHAWNLCGPGLLGTLFQGGTAILAYHGSTDEIFALIQKYKVTHIALVPSLVKAMIDILKLGISIDISSLYSIQIGGSMSTPKFIEDAYKYFKCIIQQAYGMSEGLVCGTHIDDDLQTIMTTHGEPVSPGDDVKILDENDNVLPEGEIGQIAARGPSIITEYYNDECSTTKSFTKEGYYKTGDKGRKIGKKSYIQVLGRIQEQINRMGEKIMPSELEDYLSECQWIEEAYVIPIEDDLLVQKIYVFAKIKNKCVTLELIREFLRDKKIAEYKQPDELIVMDYFPYTAVGKVDKEALKQTVLKKGDKIC